jgi:hypothetical protein
LHKPARRVAICCTPPGGMAIADDLKTAALWIAPA